MYAILISAHAPNVPPENMSSIPKPVAKLLRFKPLYNFKMGLDAKYTAKTAFSDRATPPILIYQMGKVGSASVYYSLKQSSIANTVLHLHFLSHDLQKYRQAHIDAGIKFLPDHLFLGAAIRQQLDIRPDWPVLVISLVRDPIAITISNLFQNPDFAGENIREPNGGIHPEKAHKLLERTLSSPTALSYIETWFNNELKKVFGIDVFAQPFAKDVGYQIYREGNVRALILRLENLIEWGPSVISDFLGIDKVLTLYTHNARNKSKDKNAYQKLYRMFSLSEPLCEQLYSSRFAQHFYSPDMTDRFISKWSRN